ncbi:hypothetical protein [Streptomyces sclerotialus]|uniref:hypothetical protein n=1 Tax=Streptomyces sclerotialus TaxID=1957 RepID=UPI0004CAE9C4
MFNVDLRDSGSAEALLRASVLFKFEAPEEADPFVGSPRFAEALTSLLESIVQGYVEAGQQGKADAWRATYRLSARSDRWRYVAEYATRHPGWSSLRDEERANWVATVAAPYWLDDGENARMSEQIDALIRARGAE